MNAWINSFYKCHASGIEVTMSYSPSVPLYCHGNHVWVLIPKQRFGFLTVYNFQFPYPWKPWQHIANSFPRDGPHVTVSYYEVVSACHEIGEVFSVSKLYQKVRWTWMMETHMTIIVIYIHTINYNFITDKSRYKLWGLGSCGCPDCGLLGCDTRVVMVMDISVSEVTYLKRWFPLQEYTVSQSLVQLAVLYVKC
jgi:hypothetical protein